ncbi:amino acid permease [Bradyrhizobium symbiodeficiens]|uniref:APC family permease n=1 Tax=Bradyrhizobium symbiodeficiens TaxID=1404367 RepID=UPI0030CE2AD5
MTDSSVDVSGNLRRRLGLPLLVLYGTGITIGAGIYVLIGAVAGHAGSYSVWSFLLAALVMGLTVASYAEMATRYPVSAGEAAYVRAAFNSRLLSTIVGLLTLCTGVVAAGAVTLGSVGYIRQFVDLPPPVIVVAVVMSLGAIAAWGILESVVLAGVFTVIEAGGLAWIILAAIWHMPSFPSALVAFPPMNAAALSGIAYASLLAFFAFVGFEDLANVVEEARVPHRDIPRAMVLTLLITSVLYILVAAISITAVPTDRLAASPAPLSLVFRTVTGMEPVPLNVIAVVATLNTVLAQMTMAARVIYGMSRQGDLPRLLSRVHASTGTPVIATGLVMLSVIALALAFPIERLATGTSVATLATFAMVNLSLLCIRARHVHSVERHVRIPIWVPILGFLTCLTMIGVAIA